MVRIDTKLTRTTVGNDMELQQNGYKHAKLHLCESETIEIIMSRSGMTLN